MTIAIDSAVITPAALVAGLRIRRSPSHGYLLAAPLLVVEAMLAPMIAAQSASQLSAGVRFATGELVGPVSGFAVLSVAACWILVLLLRAVSDPRRRRAIG